MNKARHTRLVRSPFRTIPVICLALAGLGAGITPVQAAQTKTQGQTQQAVTWQQRDTAVYVVSTLNLLHTRHGRPLTPLLMRKLGATHLDVYADRAQADLYFIQLKRADGATAGTLAYQMGWMKPQSVTATTNRFGITAAAASVVQAYQSDPTRLIGSFTSTFPS